MLTQGTVATARRVLGASLALGTLLSFAGCSAEESEGLTREEYIEVYVEILLASAEARDSVAASLRTVAILEERGLTEDELLEFAERYIDNPQELSEIWGEIEARLRAPPEEEDVEDSDEDPPDGDTAAN